MSSQSIHPGLCVLCPGCCQGLRRVTAPSLAISRKPSSSTESDPQRRVLSLSLLEDWAMVWIVCQVSSLPELMDFKLFGKTILAANRKIRHWPAHSGSECLCTVVRKGFEIFWLYQNNVGRKLDQTDIPDCWDLDPFTFHLATSAFKIGFRQSFQVDFRSGYLDFALKTPF